MDLLIIGAMKCGTSALFDLLVQTDKIVGSRIKEPGFFSGRLMTLEEYKSLWDKSEQHIKLEATANYYCHDNSISRILKFNPSSKFIFIHKHPILRAKSHILHESRYRDLSTIKTDKQFLEKVTERSMYYTQIKNYYGKISDKLLCIETSQLNMPHEIISEVSDFLEIKLTLNRDYKQTRYEGHASKSKLIGRMREQISEFLLNNGLYSAHNTLRKNALLKQLYSLNQSSMIENLEIEDFIDVNTILSDYEKFNLMITS